MQRTTIDYGIDLGTTNSSIAVIDDINSRVIPNRAGSVTTPSAVYIDKRGKLHVGAEAKLRAASNERPNVAFEFKQRMGLADGAVTFERSGQVLSPEALSAEVLKELKLDVRTSMSEDVRAAVITVPAAFENPSTSATIRAAELAGFSLSPLLLEPVAASLAYGFQTEKENVYWFVYDFGGGTFDAAVMRIRDGLIQVVQYDGDNHLGGKLIDWDIVTRKLIPAAAAAHGLTDLKRGDPKWDSTIGRLKYYAEIAKIEVCRTREPYELWIDDLCNDSTGESVDFSYTLTPEDVEEISRPYIERSLNHCRNTLAAADLGGGDLDRVLMVGGTTLNPWVREAVEKEIGAEVDYSVDPITVVARGAAIFAATQDLPADSSAPVTEGTWKIDVEHRPVGNVEDPDIGGRVNAPTGMTAAGYTIEFVDSKTQWRSGKLTLGDEGVFMTQLYAERQRRHEYLIELCDPTGSPVATMPDRVSYMLGVIPEENPPATWTIGVGLANRTVSPFIKKGDRLPVRRTTDHRAAIALRAGKPEDELLIPLLEGEHARSDRNYSIGTMRITGDQIKRDLPAGSQVELTVFMDKNQQLRIQAYVPVLDEDFEADFNPQMKHSSLDELRQVAAEQQDRLSEAREQASRTGALRADAAIDRISNQELVEQVDALVDAAETEPEAVAQLDRRLRELAAAIDEIEDAVDWPVLIEKVQESERDAQRVVDEYGDTPDRNRLTSLKQDVQRAIDAGDSELLRRFIDELDVLYYRVLERQDGYHVQRFRWLEERVGSMRDVSQAEQVVAQGRRAINNNDIDALKAANRQLLSLLPESGQDEAKKDSGLL